MHITRVNLSQDQVTREKIPTKIPMANGGINYGKHHMLFCAQGSMTEPSGLYRMSMAAPYESELLKQDFFGRPFNPVKDVVVHADGSVWFADPIYGYEQEYRPTPCLPNQVYWWCPNNGCIKAMADRSEWPNGICFSPDEKVVYITDTDRVHGDDGTIDNQRVSSMYMPFSVMLYFCIWSALLMVRFFLVAPLIYLYLTESRVSQIVGSLLWQTRGSQTESNATSAGMSIVAVGMG